jgi:hypothetical protein
MNRATKIGDEILAVIEKHILSVNEGDRKQIYKDCMQATLLTLASQASALLHLAGKQVNKKESVDKLIAALTSDLRNVMLLDPLSDTNKVDDFDKIDDNTVWH